MDRLLEKLIATWENETIEFKQADKNFSLQDIGKYFSALANEALIHNQSSAWLIFGVNDKNRSVTGTSYRASGGLEKLKHEITNIVSHNMTFKKIHEFFYQNDSNKRVIIFEIPPAPEGMPISSNDIYYGRSGESITPLSLHKLDEIRKTKHIDWTAQIVPSATVEHLDQKALKKARELFTEKHANRIDKKDIESWSDIAFLNKARITQDGKITKTALLLLGKADASYLLEHDATITWYLKTEERAYEHFTIPFLLNTTEVYNRIRNIPIRLLPDTELIEREIPKYDKKMLLEALHNCIAHQDYKRNGRIIVTEEQHKLIFENTGNFFEGKPEDYILHEKTPKHYRNPYLVEAMVTLNMVDRMGFGIHNLNHKQRERYLPLPDYDLSDMQTVKMTVYGSVVDEAYTKVLMQNTDLMFEEVIALDRVQKKSKINDKISKKLLNKGLIEGRKPNYYVSAHIAKVTKKEAEYGRNKPFHDSHYQDMIIRYIEKYGSASRNQIGELLSPILSEILSEKQKKRKIDNLLQALRKSNRITNQGNNKVPQWVIISI